MQANGQSQNELEQRYIELYRCMIEKDLVSLSDILDSSFVLVHMTGMQQDKQSFIHSIDNGTLNYYTAVHEAARSEVEKNQAHFIGESRVTASVFGGGKYTWRLRLQIQFVNRNGKWMIGKTVASTY